MYQFKTEFSIDKKLKALQPHIDLKLYYNSIDYRRKIICLFKKQEQELALLKQEFDHCEERNKTEEYDCVLGYN